MGNYRLSRQAADDFERIFDFGIDRFGIEQAQRYQLGMLERFDEVAEAPDLYREVEELSPGLRRSVYGSHSIYYQTDTAGILVVRILGRESVEEALS